jgi:hypothetical protein
VIPNFYVVYGHDAAPLTTKLKFQLALKASADAVTIAGTGLLAASKLDVQVVVETKFGDPFKAWVAGSSPAALTRFFHKAVARNGR